MPQRPPPKKGPAPVAIIALALLGLGSCVCGIAPHLDPLFISKPVHVTGRVVDLRAVPKGGLRPVVAFAIEGQRVRFEPKWSSAFSPVGIGEEVDVTYSAEDPTLAALSMPFGFIDTLELIGGTVAGLGAVFLVRRWRRERQVQRDGPGD